MRYRLGWIFAAAILLPGMAHADDTTTLAPAIAQCINENAAKVEAAVSELNQAVDFLVSDVCAEPIAAQAAQQGKVASEHMAAQWKKMCDEETPEQKKAGTDYCTWTKAGFLSEPNDDSVGSVSYAITSWNRPAAAVALASRRLLDLRLARISKGAK